MLQKLLKVITIAAGLFSASVSGLSGGKMKENALLPFPITIESNVLQTSTVIDANWRWARYKDNYENCFTNEWVAKYCPDQQTCTANCVVEGTGSIQDYQSTYGVSTTGNSVTLKYVTVHPYGTNVGSRLYLLAPDGRNYQGFNLLNREFVFTADMSRTECGLNGAIYFVEMPLDGNINLNNAGPTYGIAYGDAQMPKDIKYIDGFINHKNLYGPGSNEYDVWEANRFANAYTAHICKIQGVKACTNDVDCGVGSNRYKGLCDKDGADMNLYRNDPAANAKLYGPGSEFKVDTTKPFEVRTQFITNDNTDQGQLVKIIRKYRQNGVVIDGGYQTDETIVAQKQKYGETNYFTPLGGLKAMGEAFRRGMVLAISFWDDSSPAQMKWLDSVYPVGGTKPGDLRGPCNGQQDPAYLRSKYPNAQVVYSNFQVNRIGVTPTPTYWKCQNCVPFV